MWLGPVFLPIVGARGISLAAALAKRRSNRRASYYRVWHEPKRLAAHGRFGPAPPIVAVPAMAKRFRLCRGRCSV